MAPRDDGAIIGYKPDLKYTKEVSSTSDSTSSTAITSSDDTSYSTTLTSISENLPSSVLTSINYVSENLESLISQLAELFKDKNYDKYRNISAFLSAIKSGNTSYVGDFISYHSDDITGSILPELILEISNAEKRLELLDSTLKKLYYGDENITLEEAQEVDSAYLAKLKTYETTGEISKINYLTVSQDAILNKSVSNYVFMLNARAIEISEVSEVNNSEVVTASQSLLIQSMFNEINTDISIRQYNYNNEESSVLMVKSLYNYYNNRETVNNMYSMLETTDSSIFIAQKTVAAQKSLTQAISNINKSLSGNTYYLSKIATLEEEKAKLKNIYLASNYNAE